MRSTISRRVGSWAGGEVDDGDSAEGILGRTMRVLRCFTDDESALSAARLATLTGLAPSTLHRLLGRLCDEGMLARISGHRYVIGARLFELGELSPLALHLRETALPVMLGLYEATGENVHLAVLDARTPETATALFVGRITGRGSIPTLSRMGGRHPLHTTGVGKALLSTRDAEWLAQYFSVPLERETTHSITSEDVLRAELETVRTRGYATTREEMTLGNVSVASALPPVDDLPPIALGVVAHLEKSDVRRLGGMTAQAARDLAKALRDTPYSH